MALATPVASSAQTAPGPGALPSPAASASVAESDASSRVLAAGAPLTVMLNDTLSSQTNQVGDRFQVVVAEDVSDQGVVVIPKGTIGYGEVTFSTSKGGWGKGGILGITLRNLELNGKTVEIDGRYREEGKQRDGAASATMFAVGIFAALVKGGASAIPKGRLLKAHTAADISYVPPSAIPPRAPLQPAVETVGGPAASATPASDGAPVTTGTLPAKSN